MPVAYQCRWCKGPPLPHPWEGACPNCKGYYRANRIHVAEGDVEDAEMGVLEEGEPISAGDLMKIVGPEIKRYETGLVGLDYICHGGLPEMGAAVLLAAEPGTGKSTLMMVLLKALAARGIGGLYISAEQSLKDLGQQFSWLAPFPQKHMILHHATRRDEIVAAIEKSRAKVVVVDSLQAVTSITDDEGYSMAHGHAAAVAHVGMELKRLAGQNEMTIFAIGHVNKDGKIAGGSRVIHWLDGTLVFRHGGGEADPKDPRRILQFEGKSRLCPLGRKALFRMETNRFVDCGALDEAPVDLPERQPRERSEDGSNKKKKKGFGPN